MAYASLRFVIIEEDPFIAADMEAGLHWAAPGCSVIHLRDVRVADALPRDLGMLTVFITGDRLSGIDASGLGHLASDTGSEIVVREGLDSIAAVEARGYHSLRVPFTDATLLQVTRQFPQSRAA